MIQSKQPSPSLSNSNCTTYHLTTSVNQRNQPEDMSTGCGFPNVSHVCRVSVPQTLNGPITFFFPCHDMPGHTRRKLVGVQPSISSYRIVSYVMKLLHHIPTINSLMILSIPLRKRRFVYCRVESNRWYIELFDVRRSGRRGGKELPALY